MDVKNSVLPLMVIILISHMIHEQNSFGDAPQGCVYDLDSLMWTCDFRDWIPPLKDEDFRLAPLLSLELVHINGNIPAGAFSGLNGPLTSTDTYFKWYCYNKANTSLTRDIFTSNLDWVIQLDIHDCNIEKGLPSRLLENLIGLRYLRITNGGIEPLVANDALAGLTNLRQITICAYIYDGKLPHGFFDGLKNLTKIDLRFAKLTAIPPNWFNGLVNLEEIYMSFNNLLTMPPGLFDDLISLRIINLHGNVWNCSCELKWFLRWSDITVGAVCQSPPVVRDVSFEDAFGLLGCITSTHTSLSTSVTVETEITETQTSFVSIFTDRSTNIAIPSQTEWRTTMFIRTDPLATPLTATPSLKVNAATAIPTTCKTTEEKVASTITSTATPILTASWTALPAGAIKPTYTLNLSPPSSAWSTTAIAAHYISTREFISRHRGNDNANGFMNNLRNIILVSTAGALLVLLVAAAFLFRYRCRNTCIGGVNRVSNDDDHRDGPDYQGTD